MAKENGKAAKWKFFGMVVTAALAAYSTIFVSLINSSGAKENSVKAIVSQLNDKIIPQLQELIHKQDEEIDKLRDKNADLRERLAKIEGMFMVEREEKSWVKFGSGVVKDKPKKKLLKKKLPRVDLQQVLK